MPELWERLESDTPKSYEAFRIYRDMGASRSLDKAFEQYSIKQNVSKTKAGRAPVYFFQWSSAHNWQERVRAWDE